MASAANSSWPYRLPEEITLEILRHVVRGIGLRKALRLRLVSHHVADLMSEAIARADILDADNCLAPPSTLARYIFNEITTGSRQQSPIALRINTVARGLCAFEPDSKHAAKLYVATRRKFCYLFVQHTGTSTAIRQLQTGAQDVAFDPEDAQTRLHDLLTAAVALDTLQVVKASLPNWRLDSTREFGFPSPLVLAIQRASQDKILEDLMAHDAAINAGIEPSHALQAARRSAWEHAVETGNAYASKKLYTAYDILPSVLSKWNTHTIGSLVAGNDRDMIRQLLSSEPMQPDGAAYDGVASQVLRSSCHLGRDDMARWALDELGAHIDFAVHIRAWSPLRTAARYGRASVVRLLRSRGASTRSVDSSSHALEDAGHAGYVDVAQALLEPGPPDSLPTDAEMFRALLVAAKRGHDEFFTVVLASCPALDSWAERGRSLVKAAAKEGQDAVVRVLARRGVPLTAKGPNTPSPLLMAKAQGHKHTVQALIALGVEDEDPLQSMYADKFMAGQLPYESSLR